MKYCILLFFLCCVYTTRAQFVESFSDGEFSQDPQWTGDTDRFEVNASHQLQLAATGADTACLVTTSQSLSGSEWGFWMKLSFNTSSNNHARVYLVSDAEDLKGPLNGYFLQAGGGSDSVSFYRQEAFTTTLLFTCPHLFTGRSVNVFRIRITRDEAAGWEIYADTAGGNAFLHEGSFTDSQIGNAGYFGIWCKFTSSNAAKFYFDDLHTGPVIPDTLPPSLVSLQTEGDYSIRLVFSEVVDPLSASGPEHYLLKNKGIHPGTVSPDPGNPAEFLLHFGNAFPGLFCDSLMITGIGDPAGNIMQDTAAFICRYQAKAYDVVIHEIMADPDPPVSLPGSEYIELFNRTAFPIKLDGWTLQLGSHLETFPEVTLPAGSYLLLSADTGFRPYGTTLLLFTSASVILNEGTELVLRDERNHVIHSVAFSSGWYDGSYKQDGGWSLEMADPDNPCGCKGNWFSASDPSGGTPGRMNSVSGMNPDTVGPLLLRAAITGNDLLEVIFSESMDSLTLCGSFQWRINDTVAAVEEVLPVPSDFSHVQLRKATGFKKGVIYTIQPPPGAADCAGNQVEEGSSVVVVIPEIPDPGDLVINEILSDPQPGGSMFIELFNRGGKPVDLKEIALLFYSPDTLLAPDFQELISSSSFLLMPDDFAVVCEDCEEVMYRYAASFPQRFLTMSSFPRLKKEKGTIGIRRGGDGTQIDQVDYTAEMHHPLLSSTEGISLERVNPFGESRESANWHSAASSAGYATPGIRNSQWWEPGAAINGEIRLEPKVFSPDNDGISDVLHIICSPGGPGYLATVVIFDSRGRRVRQLAGNELVPSEGTFTWDGIREDNTRASAGLYIVYIELFKPDGSVRKFRETTVLAIRS